MVRRSKVKVTGSQVVKGFLFLLAMYAYVREGSVKEQPRSHAATAVLYAAFTPAQQVARNLMLVARNKLRVARNTQLDAGNTQVVAGNKHHVARSKLLVAHNQLRWCTRGIRLSPIVVYG